MVVQARCLYLAPGLGRQTANVVSGLAVTVPRYASVQSQKYGDSSLMCLMVYIAASEPLPLIEWREEARTFHVTELTHANDEQVRGQFSKPHVYYVGSHTICGCGFNYGQYPEAEDDPEEIALRQRSMRDLSEYLQHQLSRTGTIELFACWDGDQGAPPEHGRDLTPALLLGDDFVFLEKERSIIRDDAA